MDAKICSKCKKEKPRSAFNRRGKSQWNKGVLRSQCKECEKGYQSQTPEKVLARVYATRKRNKEFLWQYLLEHPCADCGESDPIVLEPDHLDPTLKTDTVSRLVHNTRSIKSIEAELAKCEIVCANCHRRRTATTQGWFSPRDSDAALIARSNGEGSSERSHPASTASDTPLSASI